MSPYERGPRGNALAGRARRGPDQAVTPAVRQRGSGHLAVLHAANWATRSNRGVERAGRQTILGRGVGASARQPLRGREDRPGTGQGQNRTWEIRLSGIVGRPAESWPREPLTEALGESRGNATGP